MSEEEISALLAYSTVWDVERLLHRLGGRVLEMTAEDGLSHARAGALERLHSALTAARRGFMVDHGGFGS